MLSKTQRLIAALKDAVLHSAATTESSLRKAIAERASVPLGEGPDIPESLRSYIDKVAHAPYKVVDEDIEALRQAGHDDDAIFEVTLAAAVSAGLTRFKLGMAVLRGERG